MTTQPTAFRREELVASFRCRTNQPAVEVIASFRGEFDFLSNFAAANVSLPAEHLEFDVPIYSRDLDVVSSRYIFDAPAMAFPATENAYMAWKWADLAVRQKMQGMTPGESKKYNNYLRDLPTDQRPLLRPDYSDLNRVRIMLYLGRQKFDPALHPELAERLLFTGTATLVEGNTWGDQFFGWDLDQGKGQNYLGRIRMQVRNELRVTAGLEPIAFKQPLLSDAELVPYYPLAA